MGDATQRPWLVVDAANVVGSVPDGWWRDRVGATERLRDRLVTVAREGLAGGPDWLAEPPLDVVLVVEGVARTVRSVPGVRVVAATGASPASTTGASPSSGSGSADDAIVDLLRAERTGRRCAVVTADRELRTRVTDLGAHVLGPRAIR
jgi:hypothetical protein